MSALEFTACGATVRVLNGASALAVDLPDEIGVSVHLFPLPSHWLLGVAYEEYDMSVAYAGLGPLFFVAALNGSVLDDLLWPRAARGFNDDDLGDRFRTRMDAVEEAVAARLKNVGSWLRGAMDMVCVTTSKGTP